MAERSFCAACASFVEPAAPTCPRCGGATIEVPGAATFRPATVALDPTARPVADRELVTHAALTFDPEVTFQGEGPDRLQAPFSVVAAEDGTLLVMDGAGDTVRLVRFAPDGRLVSVVARFPAGDLTLSAPHGVAVGPDGRVYIPDAGHDRIVVLSPGGRFEGALCPQDASGLALSYPKDVDVDARGRVYIADSFNNRIVRLDAAGAVDLVLGVNADLDDDGCGDPGSDPGAFDEPAGVTGDDSGRIYVADTNNHRLQVFHPDGTLALAIGHEGDGLGEFVFPSDVRVGPDGSIYVADHNNARIQQFDATGALVAHFTLAGHGEGAGGPIGDVDVAPGGLVYVPFPERGVVVRGRVRPVGAP